MTSTRSGRGGRPSISLSADTSGRSGERLAMVWTVKTSDGAEERRGTGEDGGGILRPGSLSLFFVCSFAMPYHHHLKEEDEDEEEAGRMAERRGDALWLLFAGDVVARCGDGIALNRMGWPSFPHPVRCCERVRRRAAGDGVDGVDIRRSRREARNWRR